MGATAAYYVEYWNGVVCIYAIILSKSNIGVLYHSRAFVSCGRTSLLDYANIRGDTSHSSSDYGASQFDRRREQPSRHNSVFDAEDNSFGEERVDCLPRAGRVDHSI